MPVPSLIDRISALDPREFEHLVFDLLALEGFRNLIWLAPGADGGRDIQASALHVDASGAIVLEKWFVECKRYATSVDWPTVRDKVAYAENHEADYFLLCSTSFVSPRCKDEILTYNDRKRQPLIRYWDRAHLETRVSAQSMLLAKYDFTGDTTTGASHIAELSQELAKTTYAAYGAASFRDSTTRELDLASALAELQLLLVASPSIMTSRGSNATDLPEWCDSANPIDSSAFRSSGLRAMIAAVRMLSRSDRVAVEAGGLRSLRVTTPRPLDGSTAERLLTVIGVSADIDHAFDTGSIVLTARGHE